ncbi:MAG: ferritin family protein [candidate division Zixibacteria bacterium]|nr:ferritin family protein [candidate division Zixibacteria bacterium]MDH3937130.1 ferritin family protein [candidate division Zixibacteria bacterium]MDH4033721.1 ferritin family protein [candidate division Zixibacteria bacterium]
MAKMQLADVLKTAIKGEEDGYKFYDLLAAKATNPEAKRKLENLRNDEIAHKKVLYQLYEEHVGGEIGELPKKGLSALAEVFRKGHLDELKSEMEFINLAIEAELAATKYYNEHFKSSDNEAVKLIFERLASEENTHYELLMAEREALSGNYFWFGYDESAPQEH